METGNLRAEVEGSSANGVYCLSSGSVVLVCANQNGNAEAKRDSQSAASETVVPLSKEDSNGTLRKESYDLKPTKDNEKKESDYYEKPQWKKIDGKGKHSEKLASQAGNDYNIKHVLAARNMQFSFPTNNSSSKFEKIKDGEKKSFATLATTMTPVSKDLRGMNRELQLKFKESVEYLLSFNENQKPSMDGTKLRREGHLPSYNFSFKCDERAHKRKEFHKKIEEKVRAREIERAIMEAKLKEFEEEQIRIIRKASAFKAKPLPSFYFGRPQLKDIPSMPKPLKSGLQRTPTKSTPEGTRYTNFPPKMATHTHEVSESCWLPFNKPLQRSFPRLSPGYQNF